MALNTKEKFQKELVRKSFHLIPAVLAPLAYWILITLFGFKTSLIIAIILIGVFAGLFSIHAVGLKKGFAEKIPIVSQVYDVMKRKNEEENNIFTGGWLYFNTVLFLVLLVHPFAALMGFSLSAFGDAAAALIGGKIGKHRHIHSKRKTIEGTLGFLIVGFIYAILFYLTIGSPFQYFHYTWLEAIYMLGIITLLGAIAETVPGEWYWDQLTVPATIGISTQIIFKLQWLVILKL